MYGMCIRKIVRKLRVYEGVWVQKVGQMFAIAACLFSGNVHF